MVSFSNAPNSIVFGSHALQTDQSLKNKLAQLYMLRGKEIIQSGDTASGYAYFQQANSLDQSIDYPAVALKNLNIE